MNKVIEKIIEKLEEEKVKGIYDSSSIIGEKNVWGKAIEIVKQASAEYTSTEHINCSSDSSTNGWIPCSEPPRDDRYVLLSFYNLSVPMVGRYEEDENGGAYYIGDDMEPCVTQNIFVNAWQPLPQPYRKVN